MKKSVTLRDSMSVKKFVETVLEKTIKGSLSAATLQEKEKQAAATPTQVDTDNSSSGDSGNPATKKKDKSGGNSGASKTVSTEVADVDDVPTEDIIDKLNSIRAGKSFKDSNVATQMNQYVESLSKAEKTALFVFLRGIAQIVTGEISAKAVKDPSEPPISIEMQKSGEPKKQVKKIEPNVIKLSTSTKVEKSKENTSAPVPIKPVKR